ncbi:unnamed protein product [Orchesella dallaii]|uniref:Uncharacterized protein n=1 Tax=Orchesella dallaii TaxID=48710 RepID=A0ABP1QYL7_9HEXA
MFEKVPRYQNDLEIMPAADTFMGDEDDELDAEQFFASVGVGALDGPGMNQESEYNSFEYPSPDFDEDSEDEFALKEILNVQFFYQGVEMLECLGNDGKWYLKCTICDHFLPLEDYHDREIRENCCKELNSHIQILHGGKTLQDLAAEQSD